MSIRYFIDPVSSQGEPPRDSRFYLHDERDPPDSTGRRGVGLPPEHGPEQGEGGRGLGFPGRTWLRVWPSRGSYYTVEAGHAGLLLDRYRRWPSGRLSRSVPHRAPA